MKEQVFGLLICLLLAAVGCDKPDEVYNDLPSDYDPDQGNGLDNVAVTFVGEKTYEDESVVETVQGTTAEACTDKEIVEKQLEMVEKDIIPMIGAGGLDLRGIDENNAITWSGLSVDDAQSPDMLCQALGVGEGIVAWGDYYELIAFYDVQTREIDAIMVRPGYKGTITADNYVFEINEPITLNGAALDKTDGLEFDPRSDDNMKAIDKALIKQFRPSLDTSNYDCVDAGSCYIIMSGTQPVLVFMSVEVYIVLEPTKHRIANLQLSLKRPFGIGMGEFKVEGVTPTLTGSSAAGIPSCSVTYDTPWSAIRQNCLGDDPIEMASVVAAHSNQYVYANMGGLSLFFTRDGAIPLTPTLEDTDKVAIMSVNAGFEGNYSMPYSAILRRFKANLEADIRQAEGITAEEKTGVETLIEPDDPSLPIDVQNRYPDRLRPGGIAAAFCEDTAYNPGSDAGPHTPVYSCDTNIDGKPVMPLTTTLKNKVSEALGFLGKGKPKYNDTAFYVQHFQRAIGEDFNGGVLNDNQINFSPSSSSPDRINTTIFLRQNDERFTFSVYYGGNDDRIHFLNFQKGSTPTEEILLNDADLFSSGIFSFVGLVRSPYLGLGAKDTVKVEKILPETRRAEMTITVGETSYAVETPYLEASSVIGYWIPIQGVQDTFMPADRFVLGGGSVSATFYMSPVSSGSGSNEIVAVFSNRFFGNASWCGQQVTIGDSAAELLTAVAQAGYPCEMIVRRSENHEFITELYDMDAKIELSIADDMVTTVGAWLR